MISSATDVFRLQYAGLFATRRHIVMQAPSPHYGLDGFRYLIGPGQPFVHQ